MTIKMKLFFSALALVESGNDPSKVGDNGKSIGPYQIQKVYYLDAKPYLDYDEGYDNCYTYFFSEEVMKAYWTRYCPNELAREDFETLARVHNGGPKGASKEATKHYWTKVKKEYDKLLSELRLQDSKNTGQVGSSNNSTNKGKRKNSGTRAGKGTKRRRNK